MARFAETSCSQCGRSFGPGDSGFSHCIDHPPCKVMMADDLYERLNGLRNEYRVAMNRAAQKAQEHSQTEEMDRVSEFSTESERKREAFSALNRAIKIVEDHAAEGTKL